MHDKTTQCNNKDESIESLNQELSLSRNAHEQAMSNIESQAAHEKKELKRQLTEKNQHIASCETKCRDTEKNYEVLQSRNTELSINNTSLEAKLDRSRLAQEKAETEAKNLQIRLNEENKRTIDTMQEFEAYQRKTEPMISAAQVLFKDHKELLKASSLTPSITNTLVDDLNKRFGMLNSTD